MRFFVTYFDANYMSRALALLMSLRRNASAPFTLFALCLDDDSYKTLKSHLWRDMIPLSLQELEAADPDLRAVRDDRTAAEYIFTLTPCIATYIFDQFNQVDLLTYLDADMAFFHDPEEIFAEIEAAGASISIVPHRFSAANYALKVYGIFNVGWLSWRRDDEGLRCLSDYRLNCLRWCHDYIDGNLYADQRYLDEWPVRYTGVHVIAHPGANLAPWNLDTFPLSLDDGTVRVGDVPLIFYHYHKFRQNDSGRFDRNLASYVGDHPQIDEAALDAIYEPYARLLARLSRFAPGRIGQNHRATPKGERHPLAHLPRWQATRTWTSDPTRAPGWDQPQVVDWFAGALQKMARRSKTSAPVFETPRRYADLAALAAIVANAAASKGGGPVRVFDWGAGVGTTALALRLLLPDVAVEHHSHDLPGMMQAGRALGAPTEWHDGAFVPSRCGFDVVYALDALHYAEDWRGTLRNLGAMAADRLVLHHVPVVSAVRSFPMLHSLFDHQIQTAFSCWAINRTELLDFAAELGFSLEREMPAGEVHHVSDAPEHPEIQGFLLRRVTAGAHPSAQDTAP
ncbi:hypothetical protein ACM64Y_09160 [Novispirillum sp. DQ9]|uniref:hypothetical protein n=1 Tax=Novispirillum sp. DQ9 TaxID=3398612 RepID=UPI003C79FFD6